MPNGLKIDDLFRAKRTSKKIAKRGEIAAKSSQPIDVCFWRKTPHQVLQAGANDELEHIGPGESSLSRKIDRIGHLRVSHTDSGDAANLGAEVDSAGIRDVNN